jgi:hypothetical protein
MGKARSYRIFKRIGLAITLLTLTFATPAFADDAKRDNNPQRDPDIDRGIRENQRYNQERQDRERSESRPDIDPKTGIIQRDLTLPTQNCAAAGGGAYKCN